LSAEETSTLSSRQRQWVEEAKTSDLGFWWIVDDVRELLPAGASDADLRTLVSRALLPLLESGELRPVTLVSNGGYLAWPGSPQEILARIDARWMKLKHEPDVGDIVWFIGPRPSGAVE
jgi:hypothetical protein